MITNIYICNRIAVANADLALGRGEVDSALNILTMIGPEQIYFIQVKCTAKNYFHGYNFNIFTC